MLVARPHGELSCRSVSCHQPPTDMGAVLPGQAGNPWPMVKQAGWSKEISVGAGEIAEGYALALHEADPVLDQGIALVSQALPGVIPEHNWV